MLLFFELLQRIGQLRFALLVGSDLRPNTKQEARRAVTRRQRHAGHAEFTFDAVKFQLVFAEVRPALCSRHLFGRAPRAGMHRMQQLGIGFAHHFVTGAVKQSRHADVDIHITAGGDFFNCQAGIQARDQAKQDRAERSAIQVERSRKLSGAIRKVGCSR